jgi:hypothetical protein
MRAVSCIIAAATALAWVAGSARAQSADPPVVKKAVKASKDKAKPDKNQYWLLNPVPAEQMRSFNTDQNCPGDGCFRAADSTDQRNTF